VMADAKAQAKKALDEATARATAIHDGAERRLNLLSTRHADTIKRLTEILDGVSTLVTAEHARLSLEEEVDQATAKAIGSAPPAGSNGPGRTGPAGPGVARPAAPQAADAPSRPAPAPGPQTQPSPQVQAAALQEKPTQARTGVADPGGPAGGTRGVAGGDE
jgi:hypothetical protein